MLLMLNILEGILNVASAVSQGYYSGDNWHYYIDHGHHVESRPTNTVDIGMNTKLDLMGLYLKAPKVYGVREKDDHLCENLENIKSLDDATKIKKNEKFSVFRKDHKDALLQVKDYLMMSKSPEELVLMAKNIRNCLNKYLFEGSLTNVLVAKNYDFEVPNVAELHPSDFIEKPYLDSIIEKDMEVYGSKNPQTWNSERRKAKELKFSSSNDEHMNYQMTPAELYILTKFDAFNIEKRAILESEMEYLSPSVDFHKREKKQVRNTVYVETLSNGNFHLSKTPDLSGTDPFPENRVSYFREDFGLNSHHYNWHLVNLPGTPRRNDYFIWNHLQMVARYNAERFSVGLPRVVAYDDLRQPIEVGHSPNLGFDNDEFGERPPNSTPANFPEVVSSIHQFDEFKANIEHGISSGQVDDEGFFLMFERYHDTGHVLISSTVVNGPTNVMIDAPTSGRDTVFYRWHQHIDATFERYQAMRRQITGYSQTLQELAEPLFEIQNAQVASFRGTNLNNEIITGCSYHTIEVSNGLDFRGEEKTFMHMTHLDHVPFTHHILVDSTANEERRGVVRIFLAPRNNEYGSLFILEEQRKFWIELDKFMYTFSPGRNYVRRQSRASSVTVDCRDTVDDIAERIQSNRHVLGEGHCGCGWPQHLLVPRGMPQGMQFILFIFITDENFIPTANWRLGRSTYCGIPNVNLPDRRPMGYPFHHPSPGNFPNVYDFANSLPNALAVDVSIRFTGYQTDDTESSIPTCMQPSR